MMGIVGEGGPSENACATGGKEQRLRYLKSLRSAHAIPV